jgi:hypothetical protein
LSSEVRSLVLCKELRPGVLSSLTVGDPSLPSLAPLPHDLAFTSRSCQIIPHDFRRTAVRNLERAGVARSVAMKLTGHKTEAVYRRYAIVSEADLLEAVGKLSRLDKSGTNTGTVDSKVGDRVHRKLAEGEGFEPPRASRPGGFQVHCLAS